MINLWRRSPSGRLSGSDLIITNPITQELFEHKMIVTLILANKDEDDLQSGHKRKKAGDIIAVCPEDHYGGVKTRKTHLLLKVELGSEITLLEDAKHLMIPQFETGELWWPGGETPLPNIVARNRYKLPFADIIARATLLGITIDMNRLLDPEDDYQPLENVVIPFQTMILDRVGNKKLSILNLRAIANAGK